MTVSDLILGIETSCDETAAAIVADGHDIRANIINSQIVLHRQFGGVVPEVASRQHVEHIAQAVDQALQTAGVKPAQLAAVAVTNRPGLIGALLVGVSFAKAFAYASGLPLVGINHLKGHVYANFLEHHNVEFPAICLVVSGGHTELLLMNAINEYQFLGATRDDAAGEAFDKVARFLGLGYPGGPAIQAAAQQGQPGIHHLPRVLLDKNNYEFSFSGLKTAVMNLWTKLSHQGAVQVDDLAAEFQQAVVEVLVEKTIQASREFSARSILIAGGVAANQLLRTAMTAAAQADSLPVYYPSMVLCTDNAAMIAGLAYHHFLHRDFADLTLNAQAHGENF